MTPWLFAALVPGPGPIHGPGGSECMAEAGRLPAAWQSWHGRAGNEEPHACVRSRAPASYHRWPAGVVGLSLGFGGVRVRCQKAVAVAVAVAVAIPVADLLGDVCEGLCGPRQRLPAGLEPAGCAGNL